MSEQPQGLRRRVSDGSILAKLLPVIIVPLLTAGITAWATLSVLEVKIEMIDKRIEQLEHRIWQHLGNHNGKLGYHKDDP